MLLQIKINIRRNSNVFPPFLCNIPRFIHSINILKVAQTTNKFKCHFSFCQCKISHYIFLMSTFLYPTDNRETSCRQPHSNREAALHCGDTFIKTDNFAVAQFKTKKQLFCSWMKFKHFGSLTKNKENDQIRL